MAHFAEIDSNNKVTQVIVVNNNDAPTEEAGLNFIHSIGLIGTWLQTSYNTFCNTHLLGGIPLRKNYAGIGYTYDSVRDAFIPPKPENLNNIEFIFNEETCNWELPE
jgi:hypothetical protein